MPKYGRLPRQPDARDWNLAKLVRVSQVLTEPPKVGPTLDQGSIGACVAFAGTGNINAEPLPASPFYTNDDALLLYAACKNNDGFPSQEGTDNRTLAKMLQAWGKIDAYAFANDISDIDTWLRTQGPGILGVPWSYSMEKTDQYGVVRFSGPVAGGHDVDVLWRYDSIPGCNEPVYLIQNSWGTKWGVQYQGQGGFCYLPLSSLQQMWPQGSDFLMATKKQAPHDPVPNYGPLPNSGNGCVPIIAQLLMLLGRGTSQAYKPKETQ